MADDGIDDQALAHHSSAFVCVAPFLTNSYIATNYAMNICPHFSVN